MIWLVIIEDRRFGSIIDVWDNPVGAIGQARAAIQLCLDRLDLRAPAERRTSCEFFTSDEPYYARVDGELTVTVQRKEVRT